MMDRESVMLSIERQQRRWEKDDAERRRVADQQYSKGVPKRVIADLFRQAAKRHKNLRDA
jgi:hypothetical protein